MIVLVLRRTPYREYALIYLDLFTPPTKQLEQLKKFDPDYLLTYPGNLEHLALEQHTPWTGQNLKGIVAISESLNDTMRHRIEHVFQVPTHINYGLSELGVVASRCPEGQRYHVHSEFFYVELLNEKGQTCQPGETGKIYVTDLSNYAMPLLRFDTGDSAIATDQNCPCGRTLPCFGEVLGRYSRVGLLSPRTHEKIAVLREAFKLMPPELDRPLKKYQVHQKLNDEFHLHVQGGPFPKAFYDFLQNFWINKIGLEEKPLVIHEVDDLPLGPNGKFQDFISEQLKEPHSKTK